MGNNTKLRSGASGLHDSRPWAKRSAQKSARDGLTVRDGPDDIVRARFTRFAAFPPSGV